MKVIWIIIVMVASCLPVSASGLPMTEFKRRRDAIMDRLGDGLLLLHARSALVSTDQLLSHGFHQDANFYYFTGLENAVSAVLLIDGRAKKSVLFVPQRLSGMAEFVRNPFVPIGPESARTLLLDEVRNWEDLQGYVDRRLTADAGLVLYLDPEGAFMFQPAAESNPSGLSGIDDPGMLWKNAVQRRWPKAVVKPATAAIRELRQIKSSLEINVLRRVGLASARALLEGIRSIRPGISQRHVEAEIVRACILAGAEGPSFWPLAASGPNSAVPGYLEGLADYHHMNRVMQAGDVVHLDLGCDMEHYGGDVGRTVPVSGKFTQEQREVWDLLVAAYNSGLSEARAGSSRNAMYAAGLREVKERQGQLRSSLAKRAAAQLLAADGTRDWFLHSAGVDCCELGPELLRSGMVIIFEPSVTIDGQGYYLEDMVLVTDEGHELLTPNLPYSADQIEQVMQRPEN